MTIELMLPLATPSQNAFHFSHWRKAHKSKQDMAKALLGAIGNSGQMQAMKATGKRRLTIVRFGVRKLDIPNLIGGAKGLIDSLVAYGLLKDDDEDHLELVAMNGRRAKGQDPHTRLVLDDI